MTLPDKEVIINDVAYVYCLYTSDGRVYVGSARSLVKRIERHYRDLAKKRHHNHPLQQTYNSGERFTLEFFRCESRESAFTFEQMLITKYEEEGNLLNVGRHSKGGDNLTRHHRRDEIIAKRIESQKALYDSLTSDERKVKWGRSGELNGMFGKTHTEEVKEVFRKRHTGNKYRLGMKATAETKAKLSYVASQRVGESNPFFGKKHTEETRKKLAFANKGKKPINTNKIEIDGTIYESQSDAAKALGISAALITYRLKKNKSGYRVI